MIHRLLVFIRPSCQFIASSYVKFFCFLTLSMSFSSFTSGRRRRRRSPPPLPPPGDQVIILLGHLSSSLRATCPYHLNISIRSRIVCVTIFSIYNNIISKIVAAHLSDTFENHCSKTQTRRAFGNDLDSSCCFGE